MTLTLIVVGVALLLLAFFGWRWWQAQVSRAASQSVRDAARLAAALALSDPRGGGQLLWEAGLPRYYPAHENSEQEKALLQAWEMTLEKQLSAPVKVDPLALPQGLDTLMPAMLPAANLGLYTPQPRNLKQVRRNLAALAATSVLMERRAGRWLERHGAVMRDLSGQLERPDTLEAVSVEQWRRKVEG